MTQPDAVCGARHRDYPDTVCTEPPRHRLPHAGPLVIGGQECGGASWGPDHGTAPRTPGRTKTLATTANPQASSGSQGDTLAVTIHVTARTPGDAQAWAQTLADHVQAEYGDSMRLRTAITTPDYTPPPPGSDRDALPEHLRSLIAPHMRPYVSTACETAAACRQAAGQHPEHAGELLAWAQREDAACRVTRKQDMAACTGTSHTTTRKAADAK